MTPRQQLAYELRGKGMLQKEIASVMGIGQSRVASLLLLNKGYAKARRKYLQTPAGREVHRRNSAKWRDKNPEKWLAIQRASYHRRKK